MARSSNALPSITLVGSGNLARVLGPLLKAAGYRIEAVLSRSSAASQSRAQDLARQLGARAGVLNQFDRISGIVWICHKDDALATTASFLARRPGWKKKFVLHSSGAISSEVLAPLKRVGAAVASAHPMM